MEVFSFDTTSEQEQEIMDRIDDQGGCAPGLCATCVGAAIRGIGPFANLGSSLTPAGLARALRQLQKQEAERKKRDQEEKKRQEKEKKENETPRDGGAK